MAASGRPSLGPAGDRAGSLQLQRRGSLAARSRQDRCRRPCRRAGRPPRSEKGLAGGHGARCDQRSPQDGAGNGDGGFGGARLRRVRCPVLSHRPALSLPHPQPPRVASAGKGTASGGLPRNCRPRPCTRPLRCSSDGTISLPSALFIARPRARCGRSICSMSPRPATSSRSGPRPDPSCIIR